jgi:hypothetical protein
MLGSTDTGASAPTAGGEGAIGTPGGAFPGFIGAAPPAWGPDGAGTSPLVARGDHTHASPVAATLAALALINAAAMNGGTYCYVTTVKSWFRLEPSTQAAFAGVRVAALGKAGFLWIREALAPAWWNQTTWVINSSTGSDEAAGTALAPLATFAEFRRRMLHRWLPGTETQSVTVTLQTDLADADYVSSWQDMPRRNASNILTVTGSQTVQAGGTGVISAATAINRATGVRNRITVPGVNFATFVGMLIRAQGTTTTTAVVERDLGGDTCELSEQSVNGALGAGFIAGQTVEVIKGTKVGGANLGPSNNLTLFTDIDFDPAASAQIVNEAMANTSLTFTRCRFRGSTGFQTVAASLTFTACSFHDRGGQIKGRATFVLCAQVNQPTEGLVITGAYEQTNENSFASHTSEASTITLRNLSYAHVSGGGSASIGFFNLGAGQVGVNVPQGSLYSCAGTWGSGNHATAIVVNLQQGAGWLVPSFSDMATVMSIAGGVGLRLQTASAALDVPMAQLPHAIGPGQQPGAADAFSAKLTTGGAAVFSYAGKSDVPAANQAMPLRQSTSEFLALRLRGTVRAGAVGVPVTGTLYIDGAPTALQVTIPAGSAVGAGFVDSSHPLLVAEDRDYDVRADAPIDIETPGDLDLSFNLERAT